MKSANFREALKLANAAAWDAGNRSALRGGRNQWSLDDIKIGGDVFQEIMAGLGFPLRRDGD